MKLKIRWEKIKYLIIFGLLGILIGGIFLGASYNSKKTKSIQNVSQQLTDVSDSKINQIDSYFLENKKEIEELANLDETKKLLKQPIISDDNTVKLNVDQVAGVISKEVNNYIKNHPEKTLSDLQNDPVFQKIAVQTVGLNGYSFVESYENRIIVFSKNSQLIGQQEISLKGESVEFWEIYEKSKNNPDVFGFYDWKDQDGKIRRKYARLLRIEARTADQKELEVVVTGYVDDYKIVKDVFDNSSQTYEKYISKNDFNNLVLIRPDGYQVYLTDYRQYLGINLNWPINENLELAKSFFRIKKENKTIFSDAYFGAFDQIYPVFLIMTPVYDQGKLLGYATLAKDMNIIFNITKNTKNLGETGESYLVSRNQNLLISPLRHDNFDILVQEIKTENANFCFTNQSGPVNLLDNYSGKRTVATNKIIAESPWCLITEIQENEVLQIPFNQELWISLIICLFFCSVGLFLMIKTNKKLAKQEPILKLDDGEKGSKFKELMRKLTVGEMFLFSLILMTGYFWLTTLFFQGWNKADFYNDIPDLVTIIILMVLFFYGFKLKKIVAGKMVMMGSILTILERLIQIILQEYNHKFGLVSDYFWLPGVVIGFIGLLLIFYGFKKEIES